MTRRFVVCLTLLLVALCGMVIPVASQQSCPVPPSIQAVPHDQNMFSDQQEVDLGDALAEQLSLHIKVIYDDNLNAYLRTIGDRLVQHLPPTQMKFRFYLIELPEVNAFSIAGGRVYVARKMVALAKTDDELAGVLAHELGHIVTHQQAIEYSARLKEVLGVTQLGDRADVFDKLHLFFENEARKPSHGKDVEEKHQYIADQVALYAMGRAGYAPHAYVDLWDRFQQTHGKTGSWLSDFFGNTKPSERRLREMLKNVSALPAGCADIPPGSRTEEFTKWQTEVIGYSALGGKETLPGLAFKQVLARRLRPDVSNLRFSPDGKYVLAQDEGGIHVLTREPFDVLFYFPAPEARDAMFTPDSRSVVFYTKSLRVETWSISEQRRTTVHELTLLHPCMQTSLSPDGTVLACVNSELELLLVDVASGNTLVSKKSFVHLSAIGSCMVFVSMAEGNQMRVLGMGFSPDARYFVAATRAGVHLGWDLANKREISVPGSIKEAIQASFAFVGPDRIVGIRESSPGKSPILRFPSGERLGQVSLVNGLGMRGTTHGDYILAGPVQNGAMGLFNTKDSSLPMSFKRAVGDVYDSTIVVERLTGEIALHEVGKREPIAVVKLPEGQMGLLKAAAVSPDFNWMAISNGTRGAVWDVTHNIRTMEVRTFHGAWFAPDGSLFVDMPKFADIERQVARLYPQSGNATTTYKLGDIFAEQHGPYLLVRKPRIGKATGDVTFSPEVLCLQMAFGHGLGGAAIDEDIEVRDMQDNHVIWSRYFPKEIPAISFSGRNVVLRWRVSEVAAHDELAKFPQLKNGAEKEDVFVEIVDMKTNSAVGALVIKTNKGSFSVYRTVVVGDWVVVTASGNQVIAYSLASGQEKSHFFGSNATTSGSGLLAIERESGQLSVYDVANSQLVQQYTFEDPVSFAVFSGDGKRLFVVTASQTAYILDVTAKN